MAMSFKSKGRSRLSKALPPPPALDPLPFDPLSFSFDTTDAAATSSFSPSSQAPGLSQTLTASGASHETSTLAITQTAPLPSSQSDLSLSSKTGQPAAAMKFLPSAHQKQPKSPKEKTTFSKLFPLRSSSKKAAPQPPPMSIPRRPVPLPKTENPPKTPSSASKTPAETPKSQNQLAPPPQQSQQQQKHLSDIRAAESLTTILSAYSRTSEDHSSAPYVNMAPSAQDSYTNKSVVPGKQNNSTEASVKSTTTTLSAASKEPIRRKDAPGALHPAKSSDSLAYDYSLYAQYQNDDTQPQSQPQSQAPLASPSSATLQVPGAGLPKSPRAGPGANYYLGGSGAGNSTDNLALPASDRPVSVMTDLLSTYSSLPSETPSTPMSTSSASPSVAVSASASTSAFNSTAAIPAKEANIAFQTQSATTSGPASPTKANRSVAAVPLSSFSPTSSSAVGANPNSLAPSEPQLLRRRSVKNDLPIKVSNLALSSSNMHGGLPGRNVRPNNSQNSTQSPQSTANQKPNSPPVVSPAVSALSQDSMGHSGSKLTREKPQGALASPHKRLPTPDYEHQDVKTPIVDEAVTTLSPASSPKEGKQQSPTQSQVAPQPAKMAAAPQPVTRKAVAPAPAPTKQISPQMQQGPSAFGPMHARTGSGARQGLFNPQQMRPQPGPGMQGPQQLGPQSRRTSTVYNEANYSNLPEPPAEAMYFPKQNTAALPAGVAIQAPKLKSTHFDCMHRHQRMVRVSNRHYPLTCQSCEKAETEEFARCSWCALRICAPCSGMLRNFRGDLTRLVDVLKNPRLAVAGQAASSSTLTSSNSASSQSTPWSVSRGGSENGTDAHSDAKMAMPTTIRA